MERLGSVPKKVCRRDNGLKFDNESPQIVAPGHAIMAGLGLRDHHSNTCHGAYDPGRDTSRRGRDHDRLQNQRSHKSQQ